MPLVEVLLEFGNFLRDLLLFLLVALARSLLQPLDLTLKLGGMPQFFFVPSCQKTIFVAVLPYLQILLFFAMLLEQGIFRA